MSKKFQQFIDAYQKVQIEKKDFCVITMVATRGSAPQDVGARLITTNKGIEFGTVGGGKIEKTAVAFAQDFLNNAEKVNTQVVTWNLQKDIGMTCGGEVTLFFERFRSDDQWSVTIFGAGHVSQELSRTLARIDCSVTVYDTRSEWIDKLPKNVNAILSEDLPLEVAALEPSNFVLLMTMGHSSDLPILAEILKTKDFPYLGVIGSKAKRNSLINGLNKLEVSPDLHEKFICPIGEPIGSNAPEEIAISITAQLLKARDQFFQTKKRYK